MSSSMDATPFGETYVKSTIIDETTNTKKRYVYLAVCIAAIIFTILIGVFYYSKYYDISKMCVGNCDGTTQLNYFISAGLIVIGAATTLVSGFYAIKSWNKKD